MQSLATEIASLTPQRAFTTDYNVDVIRFAAQSFEAGHGVTLATLVQIRGWSARPLGSMMAIGDDGFYCGFLPYTARVQLAS